MSYVSWSENLAVSSHWVKHLQWQIMRGEGNAFWSRKIMQLKKKKKFFRISLRLLCVSWMPQTQGWASFLKESKKSLRNQNSSSLNSPLIQGLPFCISALYKSSFLLWAVWANTCPSFLSLTLANFILLRDFLPLIPFPSWLSLTDRCLYTLLVLSNNRISDLVGLFFFFTLQSTATENFLAKFNNHLCQWQVANPVFSFQSLFYLTYPNT